MEKKNTGTIETNWLAFSLIVIFIFSALAIVSYSYLSGRNKSSGTSGQQPSKKIVQAPKIIEEAQVSIIKSGFIPATIQVKKGTQVTWTNNDSSFHQIASDPYPTHDNLKGLEGDLLTINDSFSFIFEKTGTFTYHDHLNPSKFKGTVIVQ